MKLEYKVHLVHKKLLLLETNRNKLPTLSKLFKPENPSNSNSPV